MKILSFITASFDIECDSCHGDFPNPIGTFEKLLLIFMNHILETAYNLAEPKIKVKFIEKCLKKNVLIMDRMMSEYIYS